MNKLISFIIPHKGRENFLLETIDSVINQNFDISLIEIIIVTQNEQLSDKVQAYANKISLSILPRPSSETISALRNFGVGISSGQYLAFLDADISLSKNWVDCMLSTLNDNKNRIITSAIQVNSIQAPPLEKIRTALSNATIDQAVSFLPGRNLFLSRESFQQIGGFPEHLITCEDYYFTDKANNLGDLYYTSKASYIHLGEDRDFNEMYKKEIWRGQSNLLSIKGRSIPLNEIPSFIIPIGILTMLILTITFILSGNMVPAILTLIAFLLPVTAYSVRLYRIAGDQVTMTNILKFYSYYFPARAIGTIGGIFKTFNTKSHN